MESMAFSSKSISSTIFPIPENGPIYLQNQMFETYPYYSVFNLPHSFHQYDLWTPQEPFLSIFIAI